MTNRVRKAYGLVPVLALFARAAAAATPEGHWEGAIETPGQELRIEVDLSAKNGGAWSGRITIPAQGLKGFPLSRLEVSGNAVSFAMQGVPGDPVFQGRLADDPTRLEGEFTQGGARLPFRLKRTGEARLAEVAKSTPVGKELEGRWEGSLATQGMTLRLRLSLTNAPDGATGSLVSVDQGGVEIPIATITQTESRLKLELPAIGAVYEGGEKDGRIVGEWRQGGATMPLVFKRPAE